MPQRSVEACVATVADQRSLKLLCFLAWLCLVLVSTAHHAFWRDEVRALSLARQGDGVIDMLRAIHGEGHPAIWYLLLRGASAALGASLALPTVSIVIAGAAMLLLVLRSPFRLWVIGLLLLGKFALFEYSVMARNYGISMLCMFLLAEFYPRHRHHGILLGVLLFCLANTNAHSVLLTGAFLVLWVIDLILEQGLRWTPPVRTFLCNAGIAGLGVVACGLTLYPPFNDAAVRDDHELSLRLLANAVVLPGKSFSELVLDLPLRTVGWPPLVHGAVIALTSAVLYASMLGLLRRPAAFVAALVSLVGFSLFFVVIYPGFYRHEALWLAFLVMLYWITLARDTASPAAVGRFSRLLAPLSVAGSLSAILLVTMQVPTGLHTITQAMFGAPPLSRARDLGAFVLAHPDLRQAIIIGDPDFLVEALPYYIPNRTYLLREQRFGNVVRFTKNARLSLSLEDILTTARTLRAETGQPVLIMLTQKLDRSAPARTEHEGFNWELQIDPAQVDAFLRATRFVANFSPASRDEFYDVYEFDAPSPDAEAPRSSTPDARQTVPQEDQ
jgi:hypothetical protein